MARKFDQSGAETPDTVGDSAATAPSAEGHTAETYSGPAEGPIGEHADEYYAHERLALDDHGHLPWLDSGDDYDDEGAIDTHRVIGTVVGGLAAIALLIGGIWWWSHRDAGGAPVADGSTISAPATPDKTAPANPGGKTFAGTGDTSFAVSQGKNPSENLAEKGANGGATAAPAPSAPSAPTAAAAPNHAGVVQVGAFYSQARAEAGWAQLAKAHAALASVQHRITTGQVDNATVYRLQALTEAGGGGALCDKLRADGVACQVKN